MLAPITTPTFLRLLPLTPEIRHEQVFETSTTACLLIFQVLTVNKSDLNCYVFK